MYGSTALNMYGFFSLKGRTWVSSPDNVHLQIFDRPAIHEKSLCNDP